MSILLNKSIEIETVVDTPKKFADRMPCHWTLTPTDDSEDIVAVNVVTNETFSGSIAEFNQRMKG